MNPVESTAKQAPVAWRAALAAATVMALAACASAPDASGSGAAPASAPAAGAAGEAQPPDVVNRTPFPNIGLTGVDKYGEYTSLGLKISYTIDTKGEWVPAEPMERMLNASHDIANDYRCMSYGGGYNQRTVWYPDTGIFVRGAQLAGLASAQGAPRPLLRLHEGDNRTLAAAGPGARDPEYGYVPCVGAERVNTGHRASGYVKPGDRIELRPTGRGSRPVTLTAPRGLRPYVILDFAGRSARALVPANLVVLSIDWPRRRAVAQYQVTVAMQPQVAKATWMTTLQQPTTDAEQDAVEINAEVDRYLATCPSASKPMDPCANPHGELPLLLRRQ